MPLETEQLARLIDAKAGCVRQLHALGQLQLQCIAAGDFTQLMRILGGKQRLLAQLPEIERSLDPFRQQAPETRRWSSPAERARCAALAAECEKLLSEIVEQEKSSERQMVLVRDRAATQLQGAHFASQARGAYQSTHLPAHSQLDLSSDSR